MVKSWGYMTNKPKTPITNIKSSTLSVIDSDNCVVINMSGKPSTEINKNQNVVWIDAEKYQKIFVIEPDKITETQINKPLEYDRVDCVMQSSGFRSIISGVKETLDLTQDLPTPDGWDISDHPEIFYMSRGEVRKLSNPVHCRNLAKEFIKSDKTGVLSIGAVLEEACFESDLYTGDGGINIDKFILDLSSMPAGPCELLLHDGSKLEVAHDGSYKWISSNPFASDSFLKRLRKTPPLEFNQFVNASDVLENFIQFCENESINLNDFKKLPIELYIIWLVQEAEKADDINSDDGSLKKLTKQIKNPKCVNCGKFIEKRRATYTTTCSEECVESLIEENDYVKI